MNITTEAIHFSADRELMEFIENRLKKLEQFFDRIIDAQVFLKLENNGQIRDKIVELKLNVPGNTLFVEQSDKSFEAATDRGVEALRRQLIKHKETH